MLPGSTTDADTLQERAIKKAETTTGVHAAVSPPTSTQTDSRMVGGDAETLRRIASAVQPPDLDLRGNVTRTRVEPLTGAVDKRELEVSRRLLHAAHASAPSPQRVRCGPASQDAEHTAAVKPSWRRASAAAWLRQMLSHLSLRHACVRQQQTTPA